MQKKIKEIRENKKISLRKLGRLTGIPHNTISNYENNKRKISLKNAILIAKILEIKIEELYEN